MTKKKGDSILTQAEKRVAEGYASGYIGKEIADKLGLSYNTVVRHTQNIYDKTGIRRSTNSLTAWFLAKKYGFDLSEIEKQFGAFLLVCLLGFQIVNTDFGDSFVRNYGRRSEMRAARGRRGRRDEEDSTLNLIEA